MCIRKILKVQINSIFNLFNAYLIIKYSTTVIGLNFMKFTFSLVYVYVYECEHMYIELYTRTHLTINKSMCCITYCVRTIQRDVSIGLGKLEVLGNIYLYC